MNNVYRFPTKENKTSYKYLQRWLERRSEMKKSAT